MHFCGRNASYRDRWETVDLPNLKSKTGKFTMEPEFIQAIQSKNKVRLTFSSKEDGATLVRTCAPMDFGPSRRAQNKSDRFHLWDYDSDMKNHTLSLLPAQVVSIEVLAETFEPSEFVTWSTTKSPWFIPRDWGVQS
jgi:hypothetical protein